ncbi:hypothetical protein SK128_011680 [Halocaridina rubra]|uniref:Ashwin n=1 Tax=Halocaridina rubra TaxID=373956 RepID=A0AAN8ZYD6_HALRR
MARRGRANIVFDTPVEEKKNEISFLQPEILPLHIMENILKQRGFSPALIAKTDRRDVIKYFYKHISPKFQRDYRDNRRGKILKKMRARRERKIAEDDWQSMLIDSKGKSFSHTGNPSRDHSKSSSYQSSESNKSFDNIVINDHKVRSRQHDDRPSKSLDKIIIKEHKVRSNEDRKTEKKRSHDQDSDSGHKQIKLSTSEKRPSETGSNESAKRVKLQRTGISWP